MPPVLAAPAALATSSDLPADPAAPFLRLDHVSKHYGEGAPVLADFSLTAWPGDFIALIGPSGCGKSTLLRLLSGLTAPSSGQVHLPTPAPELGYVFQDATLLPWLDVSGNVESLLRLRGVPAPERARRAASVLAQVRLTPLASRYPRQLSGGQRMRVSLARALALDPALLLLDEPFGALDEMTRDLLNEELLHIRAVRPWVAFFVTHSVAEAVFLANRVVVLAPAPGRMSAELAIPLPYPRTAATRRDPVYHQHVATVTAALRAVLPA